MFILFLTGNRAGNSLQDNESTKLSLTNEFFMTDLGKLNAV